MCVVMLPTSFNHFISGIKLCPNTTPCQRWESELYLREDFHRFADKRLGTVKHGTPEVTVLVAMSENHSLR